MAQEKTIYSRQQQKHDIESNWLKATNFIPKEGEIIIYDAENTATILPEGRVNSINYARIKIGDGKTNVNQLSFSGNNNILVVTSYSDEEYGDIASHGPYEIYEAVNNNKLVYLLYKDLIFTCIHVKKEVSEVEFLAVDSENYKRVAYIGEYLKNDSEDEYYYSISEAEIGSYGKILLDFDLNNYTDETLPEKITDIITADINEGGMINDAIYYAAELAAYPTAELTMQDYELLKVDEESEDIVRNVPTYEEVESSIGEITPGSIGAAYGEFLCIELTEEDDVFYASFLPSIIVDIVNTNVAVYLNVEGNLLPCVYLNYDIAKFYDINTHSVYSISNEDGSVTVEDFTPLTPLIVTSSNNISNYSSQEIFEAAQAGRTVYLKIWSGTYLKLSWVNGTEATFDYPGVQSIISSDGSSHNTHTFRTVVIQNNDVFYKSIPMASQSYVDAQIGDIESVLDNIITLQTSLIGGNE